MKSVIAGTYGIDSSVFSPKEKMQSRKLLNLPLGNKILLYTGRFYPDKNIGMLLNVFSLLQKKIPNLCLVMSIIFKDDYYYDRLSEKLKGVIVFENLPLSKMAYLYSAADLFVSCSTSYFETFGRSPLESIACGTPVIVPDWMGFKDYITNKVGTLVPVDYLDAPLYDDMSYHIVDPLKFVDSCLNALLSTPKMIHSVPRKATSAFTITTIKRIIDEMIRGKKQNNPRVRRDSLVAQNPIIEEVYRKFHIETNDDLFYFLTHDFKKVIIESNLNHHIYNSLFTRVLGFN
jgi:glycosyltransferase involved in cell wall biosynthesis